MKLAIGDTENIFMRQDTDYRGRVAILGKISNGGNGTMPGFINCLATLKNVGKIKENIYAYKFGEVDIIEPIKVGVSNMYGDDAYDTVSDNVSNIGYIDKYLFDIDITPNIMPDFDSEIEQEEWEKRHYWKYIRGARKHYDDSWFIPYPSSIV